MKQPLLSFLDFDNEMSRQIRSFDWSSSPLGLPENWSDNLKAKLSTLTHSSFPMFLFWGEELTCFYNDAFRPSLGNEGKHPAIGKRGKEVWSEIWDFIGPLIEGVMTTGKPVWFEDQLVPYFRNGRIEDIYWTFSYSAVTDDSGSIAGVLVICTETTEKVNLFKQLQESNNLYSFAIEASELGTWDLDPLTNKFSANGRLKEWFGISESEEVDLALATSVIAEKDRQKVSEAILRALDFSSGGAYDMEYTIVHPKSGQERVVRAKGKATFDEQQRASRFNGTMQDITAEVLAREENRKLSVLVENSVDLMAILKMDGTNSYINKAGKELLGIDADADVTTIPISDFHTPEQFAFVASEVLPTVLSTGKWAGQSAIRNGKTGEIIPLFNNCHRIDDERTGAPMGVGTVMRDIRSELNARQRLEEEVQERTKELLRLNEELERKNKDLASLAFISSHDLQEPLRKISTFISRIEEDNQLSEKNAGYFSRIKTSAKRMQVLINDLLNFSRTSAPEKHFEMVDLSTIIQDIQKELQDKIEETNTVVTYRDLPRLNAIPFQLNQLFTNLISNSVKFAKAGQAVQIDIDSRLAEEQIPEFLDRSVPYHQITIADNGIGFEPQYRDRIFEAFQRLHSKDAYEGTGIGLSICKRIMENHEGYITAEGNENEGARFILYFPVG